MTLLRFDEEMVGVTADGRKLQVAVNDPAEVSGWTLYQSTFDPKDPSYSGLEAVHDPGIPWVFAGFALVSLYGINGWLGWFQRHGHGGEGLP